MGHNFFMQMRLKVPRKMLSHLPWGRLLHHRCSEASVLPSFPSQPQVHGVSGESLAARRSQNRHKLIFLSKSFVRLGFKVTRKVYEGSRC